MASEVLEKLMHTIGVMTEMLTDGANELHLADWGKRVSYLRLGNALQSSTLPGKPPPNSLVEL